MVAAAAKLRRDLVTSRRDGADGAVVVVKDPVAGRFFRFREIEHFIARQLDGETPVGAIQARVEEHFRAPLARETLVRFVGRLEQLGLLEGSVPGGASGQGTRRLRGSLLYLRLKAFDPDRVLGRLVGWVDWCFRPGTLVVSVLLVAVALGVSVANGAEVGRDLGRLYRVDAAVLVWLTLLGVTAVHELAHGLTCKRFGGRVHEMGLMLLYLQPALYCNVSDAWLFPERSRRLWVTFAGAYIEIVLWALATVMWRVTEPHTAPNHLALVVMLTSGVKTLFNLNPLIKLDGYYLLSDYLEIPNLRQRAFAYLRQRLGCIRKPRSGVTPPMTMSARERRIYVLYGFLAGAFSVWVLGLVTLWFGGFLTRRYQGWGVVMFAALLLAMARGRLTVALRRVPWVFGLRRGMLTTVKKIALVSAVLLSAAAALFFGRMELRVMGSFTVLPIHNTDIRAEVEGIVEELYVDEGDTVSAGDPVARLSERDYRAELERTRAELREKEAEYSLAVAGPRVEEVELATTAVTKAEERLRYARQQLERALALYERRFSSRKEFEDAEEHVAICQRELEEAAGKLRVLRAGSRPEEIDAIEAGRARLEARRRYLEQQLERTRVASPIAGVITTPKLKEKVGSHVEPGDLIAEVHELTTVTADIAISEKDISDVRLGQEVVLKARALPHLSFRGTVTAIAPTVGEPEDVYAERTVRVTTDLDNRALLLKPHMTGHAKISCGPRRVVDLVTRRLARYVRVEFWSWW
jgi:multidrug resistance efflux pump